VSAAGPTSWHPGRVGPGFRAGPLPAALLAVLVVVTTGGAQEPETGPRLRAAIEGPTAVRVALEGLVPPLTPDAWRLTDGAGHLVPLAAVLPRTAGAALLVPAVALDPARVHFVELPGPGLGALARRDSWLRTLYSDLPLGARVAADGSATTFRVFAPRADSVRLFLYLGPDGRPAAATRTIDMGRNPDGTWEATVEADLHGLWYDFTVHGPPDPGNFFFDTHPVHASDPYALVQDDALGKSRVWRDRGRPPPPVAGGRPGMEDVVAYEVHVQDFTDLLPVGEREAGTFPAMARTGLVNAHGEPVGFDYLVDLGVNVVHLMPVQEYLHIPDSTWRAAFEDDPFAREMAIDRENYQWGYRTTHPFAVEGRYRLRGAEPGAERAQFRALVRAFHERGIAVIVDVVPNHTGENLDGDHLINLRVFDLPYYFRTDDALRHLGAFGNEVKTEERPMVQRWLRDQLRHWVEELGVDGFRIDLAGLVDEQTLRWVVSELPGDLIVYGEPWIAINDPDVRANPDWAWYKADAPITFFQDDARNAFKGSPFDVEDRGWAGGDGSARTAAMQALANDYPEEPRSTAGISYLDIHDNWALADRFALHDHDGRQGVDMGAMRIAAGLLLTSAGPVVIHGGTEMLRSKGLAPREERFGDLPNGVRIHFKGRDDTYNLRAPNRFLWETLAPGSDAVRMRDWWRGLIDFRMSEAGAVFRVAEVPEGHYRFFTPETGTLLGYVVGDRVLVLANSGSEAGGIAFDLPGGAWRQVSDGERIQLDGVDGPHARLEAGRHEVRVPAGGFLVWTQMEER